MQPPASSVRPGIRTRLQYRWVICALLFAATTINYVDRQILSLLKPLLDSRIGWTDTEFGLVNASFQAAYCLSTFFFGSLVDRKGTKLGYSISIGAWSLAALAHSLVSTLGGFFVVRIALGLGEGGNFPAAIKATTQWFPQNERALATSLFNSGSNVGAVIAPMLVPFIANAWGWQWTFVAAGLAWIWLWNILFYPRETSQAFLFAQPMKCLPGNLS